MRQTGTRRPNPRPWRFIIVGGILGFLLLGLLSAMRPDRNEAYNIDYDPSVTLGYMSLFGLFLGALVGAVVAAWLAGGPDRRR